MNRKNFIVLVLAGLLVISPVFTGGCQTQTIKDVTPQEVAALIQNNQSNPDLVILDVRTQQEFTDGHIANAVNLDFYSETLRDELNKLDKSKTYLIYCQMGGRSEEARDIMKELRFQKVYNMLGGIITWQIQCLPITK